MLITITLTIILLIGLNALFVAAEFSTVIAQKAKLSKLANEGNRFAKNVFNIVEDPKKLDAYVATSQVGITISSLLLGFIGQDFLADYFTPYFRHLGFENDSLANSISVTITLIILTTLQVLIGELIPKNLGIKYSETLTILTYAPMNWFQKLFRPLLWVFNGSGIQIMKWFGFEHSDEHTHIYTSQEISLLIEESAASGSLQTEETKLLTNTLALRHLEIGELMIPRNQMFSAPISTNPSELFHSLANSQFSRVPIYQDTIDHIVGIIHIRDLLCTANLNEIQSIDQFIHPAPYFPLQLPVKDVFTILQKQNNQVAIIIDEFGGTAGMVTLEDLLEEIFGDIKDEFDTQSEAQSITLLPNNRLWLNGDFPIAELNKILSINLPIKDANKIGGLVLNTVGAIPQPQSDVEISGIIFHIEKMNNRTIKALSIKLTPAELKSVREYLDL